MCFCSTCGSTFSRFDESVGRRNDDVVASSFGPRKLRNNRFCVPSPAPSENTPDDATIVFRGALLPGPLAFPRSERAAPAPPLPRPRPRVFAMDVSLDVFTSLYQNQNNSIHLIYSHSFFLLQKHQFHSENKMTTTAHTHLHIFISCYIQIWCPYRFFIILK